MPEGIRTVYLGRFTHEHANRIAGELEEAILPGTTEVFKAIKALAAY